jgi:hypothetical protein
MCTHTHDDLAATQSYKKNCFEVVEKEAEQPYLLSAPTDLQKDKWLESLYTSSREEMTFVPSASSASTQEIGTDEVDDESDSVVWACAYIVHAMCVCGLMRACEKPTIFASRFAGMCACEQSGDVCMRVTDPILLL